MSNKKLQPLREKETKELQAQVRQLRKKLLETTPRMAIGEVQNLKTKKNLKREIAQILGIIREKELNK